MIGAYLLSVVSVVAGVGCSKTKAPPPAPRPVFKMPSVGLSTGTALLIGDTLPRVQGVDLDGNNVILDEQFLGEQATLIVFWATWCGFCIEDLPHEIEIAKKYESAGLRVIGVNSDDTLAIARAAVEEHGVPWINLFEGPDTEISNELGVNQWPTLLLLDPDGKVIISTPELRWIMAETMPDGSSQQVNGLDWALKELLENR